jgi:acetyl-CoA carboxylase carboxyltransferase component
MAESRVPNGGDESAVDPIRAMLDIRKKIRDEMGGARKIDKVHSEGRLTVREHIDLLVDADSFREIGTFVSEPKEGRNFWELPGDGVIGGTATIEGRPVTVCANDDTVRRGTNGPRGSKKYDRLLDAAERIGTPFIILGQSSGGRLPEGMQSDKWASGTNRHGAFTRLVTRTRSIPVVSIIIGPSFGSSSFYSGLSDFVVQLDDTCLSLTSPRVIEVATGEKVTMLDLGGSSVHSTITGQIDASADSPASAYRMVRSFLSFLPSKAGQSLPFRRTDAVVHDPDIAKLVPSRRTRAYDVRTVIARLVDDQEYLELKPEFSTNLVTAMARIAGVPVGIVANQSMRGAGALTPDACRKATRLICMCDAYGLPLIYLADTPGFLVGTVVERERALAKAMMMLRAGSMAKVPKCMVVLRKAFGLGFSVMGGGDPIAVDLSLAWPGAEIGFMDPKVAVNVLYEGQAGELDPGDRTTFMEERLETLEADFAPYGVASSMTIDEIIDPGETRRWLAEFVSTEATLTGSFAGGSLSNWPFW